MFFYVTIPSPTVLGETRQNLCQNMQLKQEQCLLEATWCRKVTKHKHLHTDNETVVKQAFWFTQHLNKSHTAGLYWTDILILWHASSQFEFKILTKRLTCDDVTFERSKLSNNLVKKLLDNLHISFVTLHSVCVSQLEDLWSSECMWAQRVLFRTGSEGSY